MNQPKTCAVCKESLDIIYSTPGWMRYDTGGGMYGGPLSVPQCKSCGADAYHDSHGWHVKRSDPRNLSKNPKTIFAVKERTK